MAPRKPKKTTRKPKQTADDLYQKVTNSILDMLEAGTPPWRQPWKNCPSFALPNNPYTNSTGRPYRGVNVAILWDAMQRSDWTVPQFATYKQIGEAGGQVRKGEKSTTVLLWKPFQTEKQDGTTERGLWTTSYRVFNLEQADDIEPVDPPKLDAIERNARFDEMIAVVGANVRHIVGGRAYWEPVKDRISLPDPGQFRSTESYYATTTHEHAHWTGHETRLNRDLAKRFGSHAYAAEELIAELAASFVCAEYGMTAEQEQHASYLESWIEVLRSDNRAIVTAASKAQKAADWITGREQPRASGVTATDTADAGEVSAAA